MSYDTKLINIFEKLSIISDVEEYGHDAVLLYTFNSDRIDFINYIKGKTKLELKQLKSLYYTEINNNSNF